MKVPVRYPAAIRAEEMSATVLPLPLVPATCTSFIFFCGSPSSAQSRSIRRRVSSPLKREAEWIYASASS